VSLARRTCRYPDWHPPRRIRLWKNPLLPHVPPRTLRPISLYHSPLLLCTPRPPLHPLFIIGVVAVALHALIRLSCFRALSELFAFDLTILPQHRLVTPDFYAYVRHPPRVHQFAHHHCEACFQPPLSGELTVRGRPAAPCAVERPAHWAVW
ncbi:hypothetical protein B0H14DRAFT_3861912, partial [Mycena olivaceomarginata]